MATLRLNPSGGVWLRTTLPHVRELVIIAGAYWIYMYTRSLALNDLGATALDNASTIISLEKSLGFFWEPEWQAWAITSARVLVVFLNWAYIVTFWPILLTTGTILYIINRHRYRYYRNIVLLSFVLAMLGVYSIPLGTTENDGRPLRGYYKDFWSDILCQPGVRKLLQSLRGHAQSSL